MKEEQLFVDEEGETETKAVEELPALSEQPVQQTEEEQENPNTNEQKHPQQCGSGDVDMDLVRRASSKDGWSLVGWVISDVCCFFGGGGLIIGSVFGVNCPEILLSQQMSSPSPYPTLVADLQ